MATPLNIIKNWFKTGLKPTQSQFWAWLDSFWHKDEKIPVTSVDNLSDILNAKAEKNAFEYHLEDEDAHKEILETKVDKVLGKGLSANDYTDAEKAKLASITRANMAQTNTDAPDYVLNKNRVIAINADSNLAVAWDDAEVFNENQEITITLTNVPTGSACVFTSGIGASISFADGGFTIVNLRDDLTIKEKSSAILIRLEDGRFLLRG